MKYTPRLPTTNVNVSPGSPMKDLALMLGGVLALIAGVYLALGLAVDFAAPRISHDMELKLTRMLGSHPMVRTARPAPEAVTRLAEAIRRTMDIPHPVRVLVRRDKRLNAFALPGGDLILTTGILNAVTSENELAFILGHELGHVEHRDHLRALGRGLVLMTLSALLLDTESGPGTALGSMTRLTELSFSRRQETLADEAGQDALFALYGHVNGAVAVMEKLAGADGGGWLARFDSSHPETQDRIRHLRDRAEKRGYSSGALRPVPDIYPKSDASGLPAPVAI